MQRLVEPGPLLVVHRLASVDERELNLAPLGQIDRLVDVNTPPPNRAVHHPRHRRSLPSGSETQQLPRWVGLHRIALGRDEGERASLRALWARLRGELLSCASLWGTWDVETRRVVQQVVQSCVLMFPRSTSALEGHNGQDALVHHQRHRLSETFRAMRLIVSNYVIERTDGTTAAERLFGNKPGDLIEHLCANLKLPGTGKARQQTPEASAPGTNRMIPVAGLR